MKARFPPRSTILHQKPDSDSSGSWFVYKTLGLSNKQRYALQFLHMYKLNMFLTRGRITGDFTERKQQISALNKKRFDARRFH